MTRPRLQFTDPTGPGTPTWDAFDRAAVTRISWKLAAREGSPATAALKKQYYNRRQYLIRLLVKHGQDPHSWTVALKRITPT